MKETIKEFLARPVYRILENQIKKKTSDTFSRPFFNKITFDRLNIYLINTRPEYCVDITFNELVKLYKEFPNNFFIGFAYNPIFENELDLDKYYYRPLHLKEEIEERDFSCFSPVNSREMLVVRTTLDGKNKWLIFPSYLSYLKALLLVTNKIKDSNMKCLMDSSIDFFNAATKKIKEQNESKDGVI